MLETEFDLDRLRVFTIVSYVLTIVNCAFTKVSHHLSNQRKLVVPIVLSSGLSAPDGKQETAFEADAAPELAVGLMCRFTNVSPMCTLRLELDLLSAPVEITEIVSRYQSGDAAVPPFLLAERPHTSDDDPAFGNHLVTRRIYVNTYASARRV
jgi:hypothetical protein